VGRAFCFGELRLFCIRCPLFILDWIIAMKILCIIQCSNLGGMEKLTLQSLMLLKEAGYDVEILSLNEVGDLKMLADPAGIRIFGMRYHGFAGIFNSFEVLRNMRKIRPDRIWIVGHNLGALLGGLISGLPTYHSAHYHHCEKPMIHWRVYYGIARLFIKKFHFGSKFIFEEVHSIFSEKDDCKTFINAFPPVYPANKSEARVRLGLPQNVYIVGNAGWFIHRKAFDVFLKTAARIAAVNNNVCFFICGGGEQEQDLRRLAEDLHIKDRVYWGGWISQMQDFYSAIDILLFNTRFDCLPNTPMEAMNYGVPTVVSSTYSGIKEALRNDVDGYCIDEHDEEILKEIIIKLINDKSEYERLSINGVLRMQSLASPNKHLHNLKEFLDLV